MNRANRNNKTLHNVKLFIRVFLLVVASTRVPQESLCQTYNVVRTWNAQKPFTVESDLILDTKSPQEVLQSTQYIDGFGRPMQTVLKKISPLQKDAVEMHEYDSWGREIKKYLPFVASTADGSFKSDASSQQISFNQSLYPGENFFYAQVGYENSPLNRTLTTYPQGTSWVGNSRGTSLQYLVNTNVNSNDNVQIWNIALAQGSLPTNGGAYSAGQLYKTIATDNGVQSIEYIDKAGKTVLKKVQLTAAPDNGGGSQHSGWVCTYYVYDDYGNMRFIITPRVIEQIDGSWIISQTLADELCYRYEYDLFNRVIIQKNPGTPGGTQGEAWMVYDQRGRVVMRQDGKLRTQQKWQYFQYDNLDRQTSAGLLTDPSNYNNLSYHQSNAAGTISYPNLGSYTVELLSQTFYDNYSWTSGTGLPSTLDQANLGNSTFFYTPDDNNFPYPQTIAQSSMIRGLTTGSKIEVLGSNGSQYVYTVAFYDKKGALIQTQGTNITGGIDKSTIQHSWNGTSLRILQEVNKNGTTNESYKVATKMNYGHAGRLLNVTKTINSTIGTTSINSSEKTLATYSYNEMGQLVNKTVGTNPVNGLPLETLGYEHNIRGWLTGINKSYTQVGNNSNYFGMELGYDKTNTSNATTSFAGSRYDGNVTGVIWKTRGDAIPRKYDFSYDNVSRQTGAPFLQNTAGTTWDNTYIDYSVSNLTYDLNGNIKTLNQNGFVLGGQPNIDNLTYTYQNGGSSNKLMNVIDGANIATSKLGDFHYAGTKTVASVDYGYDENGNQISDNNKNISSITYNVLNLPSVIVTNKGTITFTYDATGNKLKKQTNETGAIVNFNGTDYTTDITTITTYIGEFVYQSKAFSHPALSSLGYSESLQFFSHEEGRARIVYPLYGQPPYYAFDYFIRDHLGNIRTTLTDEVQQDTYPAATIEDAGIASEQAYYNIVNDLNHVIPTANLSWYPNASGNNYHNTNGISVPPDPTINPGGTTTKLYKLNGATGDRFGLGIALKVMQGDLISIFGQSVWHNNGQGINNTSYNITNVLSSFVTAFAGTNAIKIGGKGIATGGVLNGNSPTTTNLNSWLTSVPTPSGQTPKAYINWIFFDEQFKPVATGNGFDPINTLEHAFKPHSITGIIAPKSGYVYIYCSNESNQDVYFDNLQVIHVRGPLLEERQYYPDGLTMFGLASRAFNKLQTNFGYQGKEIQNNEFYDGSGLDEYDFEARYYDPQLARWSTQDPARQFASPYLGMGNNWVNGTDPNGELFGIDDAIVAGIGFFYGYISSGITTHDWGWRSIRSGFINAALFEVGYLTMGGGLAANVSSSGIFYGYGSAVSAMTYLETAAISLAVGQLFPAIPIQIGDFTFTIGPSFSLTGVGANLGITYTDGDFSIGLSLGSRSLFNGSTETLIGGGLGYHDRTNGVNYSLFTTYFGSGKTSQFVNGFSVSGRDASFTFTDDWPNKAGGQDKYRTMAAELTVGNFSIGTNLYTTKKDHVEQYYQGQQQYQSIWNKPNKAGVAVGGERIRSALYVGYRNGSSTYRVGVDAAWVFDVFQNGFHLIGHNSPQWNPMYGVKAKPYFYYGSYNPFTLY